MCRAGWPRTDGRAAAMHLCLARTIHGVTAGPQEPAQELRRDYVHELSHSGSTELRLCTQEGHGKEGGCMKRGS